MLVNRQFRCDKCNTVSECSPRAERPKDWRVVTSRINGNDARIENDFCSLACFLIFADEIINIATGACQISWRAINE